jgi:hypothetical protein
MTPEEKAEQYKAGQIKRMNSFKIGERDNLGYTITKIFGKGDEYVVYEIETKDIVDSLKLYIDTLKEVDPIPIENANAVEAKFKEVKGLLYKVIDKTSTKAVISHILIQAICGKPVEANRQFIELITQINKEYNEQFKNRMRLLISAGV